MITTRLVFTTASRQLLTIESFRVTDNLGPTKGEDCTHSSTASLAQISGLARSKTTESQ